MKFSIKKKMTLFIVVTITLVSALSLLLFNGSLRQIEEDEYTRESVDLARTVATTVDARRVAGVRGLVSSVFDSVENKVSSEDWGSAAFDAYLQNFASVEEDEDFLYLRD